MNPTLIAIDLGAESCRVSLLAWNGDSTHIEVVHRFANGPVRRSNGLHWDLKAILSGVEQGIRKCAELSKTPIHAIGVDGWAVDYVRLRANRTALADPFCYRDERTVAAEAQVHRILPPKRLYELTGIQILRLNTVYQLYADHRDGINQGAPWINLPEFVTHYLGSDKVAEYTNATHTGLMHLGQHAWCDDIFTALQLDRSAAPNIVGTGVVVGSLHGDLCRVPGLENTQLIVPACHDTASAIAGIPAEGDEWAFISSGTWSLVGTTLTTPCASEAARQKNFTNLGGAGNQICFLKNVNGMWLIRQCLDQWKNEGHEHDLEVLLRACEGMAAPSRLLNVDEPDLMLPGNMPEKIRQQLGDAAGECAKDAVGVTSVILHSLAERYAEVLRDIASITGKTIRRLYIVGGGSRNALLNRLTAERTAIPVFVGSTECTTVGNFAIQLAALESKSTSGATKEAIAKWSRRLSAEPEPLTF